jgi:phage-related protein
MRTPPTATVYGPTSGTMTGIEIHNHTTGEYIVFAPSYALAPGQYIVVDFVNKTITRESGLNIYDKLVFASSTWFQIEPGDNTIAVHGTGTTTGASMVLRWQDAWV